MASARFLSNGQIDASYGNGGWVVVDVGGSAGANAVALQSDGKIVLGGTGVGSNYALDFAAARLNSNGSLDSSFGHGGIATVPIGSYAIANSVAIQPGDGKIVLGGMATTSHNSFAAARLNADGTIDTTFGSAGGAIAFGPTGAAWAMSLQSDGRIVLAGQNTAISNNPYMVARLARNGTVDQSFGQSGIVVVSIGSWAYGDAVAVQPNGNIVVGGSAFTNAGVAAVVRLLPSGVLDQSFGSNGIATVVDWNGINGIALQPSDGKIVLAGTGETAVRFNANGTVDQAFGTGGIATAKIGTSTAANGVAIQPSDGAIVLAGVAKIYGQNVLSVTRLTP